MSGAKMRPEPYVRKSFMTTQHAGRSFAYDEWNITLRLDRTTKSGIASGHADLSHHGNPRHRIALNSEFQEPSSALAAVENETRAFLNDLREVQLPATESVKDFKHKGVQV
jgi:hypothetical protein